METVTYSDQQKPIAVGDVLDRGREILRDDQMELLFVLSEEETIEEAAARLRMTVEGIARSFISITEELGLTPKSERITKRGRPYRRRLTAEVLAGVLSDHEAYPLTADEYIILETLSRSRNQMIAAVECDISYDTFLKRYKQIREKYNI